MDKYSLNYKKKFILVILLVVLYEFFFLNYLCIVILFFLFIKRVIYKNYVIINIVYMLNYRDNNLNIEFKYYLELCGFLSLFTK